MTRCDPAVLAAVRELLPREPELPVTGRDLARWAGRTLSRNVNRRRIGEAVNALRHQGVPVWSGSGKLKGYRVATSQAAIDDCIEEHRRRALSELTAMAKLKGCTVKEAQMTLFG